MMVNRQVVLVTGASSGIGLATAAYLARQGYEVYGTSRHPGGERLNGFELLTLDVTDDESVARCVQTVLARAGRIDVLVNNAAVDIAGAAEEISMNELKHLFETNFFGVVRMTQAVLPHMRAQGSGRIINVTSGLGLMGLPFISAYSSSKHALEGWSEALFYELAPLGIWVTLVEPGFYRSNIRAAKRSAQTRIAAYDRERTQMVAEFDRRVETGGNPLAVARVIGRVIRSDSPALRYPVSLEAVVAVVAKRLTPFALFAKGVRWVFGLDDWRQDVLRFAPAVGGVALVLVGLIGAGRRLNRGRAAH